MPENPLSAVHESLGAFLIERAGTPVPARFTDEVEEHRAARGTAALFDLTSGGKIRVRGDERVRLLQGLLSLDVQSLGPALAEQEREDRVRERAEGL